MGSKVRFSCLDIDRVGGAQRASALLVDAAMQRGASDNVACIVVDLRSAGE